MNIENIINHTFVPLEPSEHIEVALRKLQTVGYAELPVVENGKFLGNISKELISKQSGDSTIESLKDEFDVSRYISLPIHWFEILKAFDRPQGSYLTVLDENKNYAGIIEVNAFLALLARKSSFRMPGTVMVLEVNTYDYMLSRIAQIVEAQNAKIVCLNIETSEQSPFVQIHLKLNSMEIIGISRELERYGFRVLETFQEKSKFSDDLLDNYNALMKYLEV